MTTRTLSLSLLLGCVLMSGEATAASFDCTHAEAGLEQTVCDDPKLSRLDDELAARYAAALGMLSDEGKNILRDGERRWLRFVKQSCFMFKGDISESTCVARHYKKRVDDLKTAAVWIGPFLFSRIDYFFIAASSSTDDHYEGQTSYPRIDNPSSDMTLKWNDLMAVDTSAQGYGWCDGKPGDVHIDFVIESATADTIRSQQTDWFYCHGAPHGYGSSKKAVYSLLTGSAADDD